MIKKRLIAMKQKREKIKLKGFWCLSILCLLALSIFYVFQVNALTNQSYQISILEQKAKKIGQQNEGLEVKLTQQQYFPNASKLAENLNLEKIVKIEYLNLAKPVAVAK